MSTLMQSSKASARSPFPPTYCDATQGLVRLWTAAEEGKTSGYQLHKEVPSHGLVVCSVCDRDNKVFIVAVVITRGIGPIEG